MADRKITDLTALAAGNQATGDLVTIVDVSEAAAADKNKKMTMENLFKGIPSNVGIGETAPAANLVVKQSGNTFTAASQTVALFQRSSTTGHAAKIAIVGGNLASSDIHFGDTDDEDVGIIHYVHQDNSLRFTVNASERMRIDSDGRLLVGSTSALDTVAGAITSNNSSSGGRLALGGNPSGAGSVIGEVFGWWNANKVAGLVITSGADTTNKDDGELLFYTSASGPSLQERMRIDRSGNVGISTTSPNFPLDINGNVGITEGQVLAWHDGSGNKAGDIYMDSSDNIVFRNTSSVNERMRITSSGKLVVGHSSATDVAAIQSQLQVVGADAATGSIAIRRDQDVASGPLLVFGKSRGSRGGNTAVQANDTIGAVLFNAADGTDVTTSAARIKAEVDGTPGSNDMPGRLVFETTADGASSLTERMRISNTGNIKLTGGESLFWDDAGDRYIACIGDATSNINLHGRANVIFKTNGSSYDGGTEAARIDSSGRLLIGTSSSEAFNGIPSALQIEGNTDTKTRISLFRTQNDASASVLVFAKARNTSHALLSDNDEIGKIEFYGADGSDTNQRAGMILCAVDGAPSGNDMPGRLMFMVTADGASTPSEAFNIRQNGEMESDPTYANTTAGAANVHITSGGFFARSTSSEKYKTNIETLEDSYADAILDIRPVWYRSTCQKDNSEHGWWGFIAEEVAAVDPRLVHWKTVEVSHNEEGRAVKTPCDPEPEGVAYDRFVPHLLNLIKRQQSAIETLEAKVAALEAQ